MSCRRWSGRLWSCRDDSATHGSQWKAYVVGEPEPKSLDKAYPWNGPERMVRPLRNRGQRRGRDATGDLVAPESYFHFLLSAPLASLAAPLLLPSASWAHGRHFCPLRPSDPVIKTVSRPCRIPSSFAASPECLLNAHVGNWWL